jgi:WD40 repeat protein
VQAYGQGEFAVSASHDGTARTWDLVSGAALATLTGHTGRINKVRVHSDGERALTVSDDCTAIIWDLTSATSLRSLKGHTSWLTDAVFLPEGGVVTVGGDATVSVWNAETGVRERTLDGHSGEVLCVAASMKGRFILTASEDTTARLWDLASPLLAQPMLHRGGLIGLAGAPLGSMAFGSPDHDGIAISIGAQVRLLAPCSLLHCASANRFGPRIFHQINCFHVIIEIIEILDGTIQTLFHLRCAQRFEFL